MQNERDPGHAAPRGPQPGSPRVQAWLRRVLNPLIEAVEYELPLLQRGSLTWRFIDRRPERLAPIAAYVSDSRRALEDMLRSRPQMEPPLAEHDRLLEAGVACADAAHKALMSEPEFVDGVMKRLAIYEGSRAVGVPPPSGAYDVDKLPALVADRIVNADGEVGFPYTDATFWNTNRKDFLAFATGPHFDALRAAVRAFYQHDVALLGQLKDWHFELVEEFDVEPV